MDRILKSILDECFWGDYNISLSEAKNFIKNNVVGIGRGLKFLKTSIIRFLEVPIINYIRNRILFLKYYQILIIVFILQAGLVFIDFI